MTEIQENQESLGAYLKKNREGKNISVEQVAYATRISLKMLRALEDDDHTALPASTFVRGYLQAYAKYVQLDTQDLLLRYQHHLATAPDTKKNSIRSHYLYVRERYQEKRRLVLIIVLFASMLSVAGTYFMLKAKREHNKHLAQKAELIQKDVEPTVLPQSGLINVKESEKKEPIVTPKAAEKVVAVEEEKTKPSPTPAPAKEQENKAEPIKIAETKPAEQSAAAAIKPAEAKAETKTNEAKSTEQENKNKRKTYNLLIKTGEVDVWFRYQMDDGEIKHITLRAGKAMMLRADKVIKLFSGNLAALRATVDTKPINLITSPGVSKSFIWPLSEAANYPLPLFPEFAKKTEGEKAPTSQKPNPAGEIPEPTRTILTPSNTP